MHCKRDHQSPKHMKAHRAERLSDYKRQSSQHQFFSPQIKIPEPMQPIEENGPIEISLSTLIACVGISCLLATLSANDKATVNNPLPITHTNDSARLRFR